MKGYTTMEFTTKKKLIEGFETRGLKCIGRINPTENGEMNLHEKDRDMFNYYATITWDSKKKKVKFNGTYYTNYDELLQAIENYNKTLFFDVDTYHPDMDDSFRSELRMVREIERVGGEKCEDTDKHFKIRDSIGNVLMNIHNLEAISIDDNIGWKNTPTSKFIQFYDKSRETTDEGKIFCMRSTLYISLVCQLVKILETMNRLGELGNIKKSVDLVSLHGIVLKYENFNETIINELKKAIKMLED